MNRESNLSFPLNTIYTLKGGAIMLLLICGGGRVRLPGRGPQQHPSCPEVHARTLGPGHLPLVIQVADPLLNLSGDSGLLLPDPIDVGVPSRSPKLNADAGSCCHSQRALPFGVLVFGIGGAFAGQTAKWEAGVSLSVTAVLPDGGGFCFSCCDQATEAVCLRPRCGRQR